MLLHATHQRQENVTLWNDFRGWAGANAAALRLCFRMIVAGLLAYALAELFTLPRGYWAVFSSIIIMQASVGGSVAACQSPPKRFRQMKKAPRRRDAFFVH